MSLKEIKQKEKAGIKFGDIVGVSRGAYDHYGVFVNKNEVIHYTKSDESSLDGLIAKTSFKTFLDGAHDYFVLVFPQKHAKPLSANFRIGGCAGLWWAWRWKQLTPTCSAITWSYISLSGIFFALV